MLAVFRSARFIIVTFLAAASAHAQPADSLAIPWERYELSNGLEVIFAPDTTMAEVAVEWWNRVGTRYESPGRFGLAHFFEHAMPWGQGLLESPRYRKAFRDATTDSNARTRMDFTYYYLQCRPEDVDLLLIAVADRLKADPAIDLTADFVDRHRQGVSAEIARSVGRRWGWPVRQVQRQGTFGAEHPYGHASYGSDAETDAVDSDDMIRWFRAHVRPEYITLFVAGHFDAASTLRLIESQFGAIPGGTRPPVSRVDPPASPAGRGEMAFPGEEDLVLIAWPTAPWASPDGALMPLLKRILDARLEEDTPNSLTGSTVALDLFTFSGEFMLLGTMERGGDLGDAEAWLRAHIERVVADGVSTDEFDQAVAAEREAAASKRDKPGWFGSRIELLGEGLIHAGDPNAYLDRLRRQSDASPEALRQVAARWFSAPGFTLYARAEVDS